MPHTLEGFAVFNMPLTPCSFPWARNQTQVALARSFPLTLGWGRWERCQLLVLALHIADMSLEESSSTLSQGWKMYLHCLAFPFASSVAARSSPAFMN